MGGQNPAQSSSHEQPPRADTTPSACEDYAKTLHRIAYPGAYEGSAEWSRQQAFAALKRNGSKP